MRDEGKPPIDIGVWPAQGARSRGGMQFDVSTPATIAGGGSEIALVVDFSDNSIRVTPRPGFPQSWESEDLSSVLSLAREYVQGTGAIWQIFAGHGGEVYVGGFQTEE